MRGDAMEPLLSEGDRLLVDTTRRRPTTGELCVLWDGNVLAVRRVEVLHGTEPAQLHLMTANPTYSPLTCLAKDARIVATVLWTFRRP